MVDSLVRWRLSATGTVQLVNYRERVQREALARHLAGEVEYDEKDDSRVLIDAQGTQRDLRAFVEAIKGVEGQSEAREIVRVKEVRPDPGLTTFEIRPGKARFETLERVEFARHALTRLGQEIEQIRGELGARFAALDDSVGGLAKNLSTSEATQAEREHQVEQTLGDRIAGLQGTVNDLAKTLSITATSQADRERSAEQTLADRLAEVQGSVAQLGESLGALAGVVGELDKETELSLADRAENIDESIIALAKKLNEVRDDTLRLGGATSGRLDRLEASVALLGKSLVRIETSLAANAVEGAAQARKVEAQRAALLHLAEQLSGSAPTPGKRRASRR